MSSRRGTTESESLLVVKWSNERKSLREIASLIGVTHGCVQKILQKYKQIGSVANIPGRGRKEIRSTTAKRKIIHSVKKDLRVSASKLALSMSFLYNRGRSQMKQFDVPFTDMGFMAVHQYESHSSST
ncbi:uncharacterized protein TNCT_134471 [Trichonephila clavata]|uniref:Paired domain-containing protein n=1 Tax=Trichonephila clavata TaxID=2740835 RepID=A0A8X6J542_TRICU|nr:uncharacterized protein TNCT_134471 [Trichonephila clavata]